MDVRSLVQVVKKAEQVTRIFDSLYRERSQLYAKLLSRGLFSRKKAVLARIATINQRERRVVQALRLGKDLTVTSVDDCLGDPEFMRALVHEIGNVSDLVVNLKAVDSYFSSILDAQERFLDAELNAVNSQSWKEVMIELVRLKEIIESYKGALHVLEEKVFSPVDLVQDLEQRKDALADIRDLIVEISVFVLLFVGTDVAFRSWNEGKFFISGNMPPIPVLLKFIGIASVIAYLQVPSRLISGVKDSFESIKSSIEKLQLGGKDTSL
jgi:hypothetical protein